MKLTKTKGKNTSAYIHSPKIKSLKQSDTKCVIQISNLSKLFIPCSSTKAKVTTCRNPMKKISKFKSTFLHWAKRNTCFKSLGTQKMFTCMQNPNYKFLAGNTTSSGRHVCDIWMYKWVTANIKFYR